VSGNNKNTPIYNNPVAYIIRLAADGKSNCKEFDGFHP
jgi:hypothetical protein